MSGVVTIAVCIHCGGQGQRPYNGDWSDPETAMVECHHCGGGGDLDGARLIEAYECGRRDALADAKARLAELELILGLVRESLAEPISAPTAKSIRSRVGR